MKRLFAIAALAAIAAPTMSRDLGAQGNLWDITEVDMRQLIAESASRADWSQVHTAREESQKRFLDTLPQRSFRNADKTETTWMDPSITLASDIKSPQLNANGKYEWGVMYKAGTTYNPLQDYHPATAMLFFDGTQDDQITFVQAALKDNPLGIVPVEATGANPEKLSESLGVPVYSANDNLLSRFRIQYTPSILYPGTGDKSLYLGTTAFGQPYKPAELLQVWPSKTRPVTSENKETPHATPTH